MEYTNTPFEQLK